MANYNGNIVFSGLGTFSVFTAPEANVYFVDGKVSVPSLSNGGGASSCVVLVKQNGATIYTGSSGAEGFYTAFPCASGDAITINLSSAASADNSLNAVRTTVAFGEGV